MSVADRPDRFFTVMRRADVALCAGQSFSLDMLAAQTARPCFDP